MATEISKTDAQWREELTPEQYAVLRKAGTERAFTGKYWDCHDDGVYRCAGCGAELFSQRHQVRLGLGLAELHRAGVRRDVETKRDLSHCMVRTEVTCKKCGGHLGHVFDDGPREAGGLRYCINSAALNLQTAASSRAASSASHPPSPSMPSLRASAAVWLLQPAVLDRDACAVPPPRT